MLTIIDHHFDCSKSIGTMFLSDLVNKAAAALLMAPIDMSVAQEIGASLDPFDPKIPA